MRTHFATLFAAALIVAVPQAVAAHVRVTASTPAAGATAERVRTVTLTFSDVHARLVGRQANAYPDAAPAAARRQLHRALAVDRNG